MRRVELLLGAPLAKVDAAAIGTLVGGSVHEDSDLEFKQQLYGNRDEDKRDLAGDVAALANAVGGVLVLGIEEANGAATKLHTVALTHAEELRMRQIITSLVAPVPRYSLYNVEETAGSGTGFYLIAVPQSADRPHAVRVGDGLRYPRRDGARIRWLSESEVADAYRSRFDQARAQTTRLGEIFSNGERSLAGLDAWLALAIQPLVPGQMELRHRTLDEARKWLNPWATGSFGTTAFLTTRADIFSGVGRVVISIARDPGTASSRLGHAELYQDGSGFVATPLWRFSDTSNRNAKIDDEALVSAAISQLGVLVEHATQHCGAAGDAITCAALIGATLDTFALVHSRQGTDLALEGSHEIRNPQRNYHQINLEDCQAGGRRLSVGRMLLTDVFQAFGMPEVLQISSAGALRRRYFRHERMAQVDVWATTNGVHIIETVPSEEP